MCLHIFADLYVNVKPTLPKLGAWLEEFYFALCTFLVARLIRQKLTLVSKDLCFIVDRIFSRCVKERMSNLGLRVWGNYSKWCGSIIKGPNYGFPEGGGCISKRKVENDTLNRFSSFRSKQRLIRWKLWGICMPCSIPLVLRRGASILPNSQVRMRSSEAEFS